MKIKMGQKEDDEEDKIVEEDIDVELEVAKIVA